MSSGVAVEDLIPFTEWLVGRHDRGTVSVMSSGDDLEEEVGFLLAHGDVCQLVYDEQVWPGELLDLAFEVLVGIGADELVEQGSTGDEEDRLASLAGAKPKGTSHISLAQASITDEHGADVLRDHVGAKELEVASLELASACVVVEVECVYGLDADKQCSLKTSVDLAV